jgi:hypothetical protein
MVRQRPAIRGQPILHALKEQVWSQARATVSHHHTLRDVFLRFPGTSLFLFQWLEKYAPPVLLRQV